MILLGGNIMKKIIALLLTAFVLTSFVACGDRNGGSTTESNSSVGAGGATEIYFLNFKPEISSVYEDVARDYEAATGVKVKVVTAASDTYEQTLTSEIAKTDAPTIFQINGPVGYQSWKDYCLDLSDTTFYGFLSDQSLAISEDGGIYGIPYVIEGYGIIYNEEITDKYFELEDRDASLASMDQVNSFEKLQTLVEDMQEHKDELGIEGVFASTSMSSGNQWRWQTHLANVPFYYEFDELEDYDDTVLAGLAAEEIQFKYGDNMKNTFDLYINNSTTAKGLLGSKSVTDSMSEFALGRAAMVQNGTWAWADISGVAGNTVDEEKIRFLPIYTGMEGEETQGLCIGTENYLAVNSKVSADKQKASIAFLEWLFSSDAGKKYVVEKLNFITPFNTFEEDERPSDPLARELVAWTQKSGITSVPWTFASFPSEAFKESFGSALLEYVQGTRDWDAVESAVIASWKSEQAAGNG